MNRCLSEFILCYTKKILTVCFLFLSVSSFAQKPLTFVGQMIGTNAFIDVPFEKLEAVSYIREYHPWSFTEIEDDVFEFNRWNGYWDFDTYYQTLKQMGIMVCPALWSSPGWLEENSTNKPVAADENPEDPNAYAEMSQLLFQYAARYGDTEVAIEKLLVNEGQTAKTGMGVLKYFEDWNEQDRDWEGRDPQFTAEEYAAMASANVDGHSGTMGDGLGLKTADPSAKFVMGGLYKLGTDYIEAMRNWFIENRNDKKWPIDVINMHHYAHSKIKHGICPEEEDFKSKIKKVIEWRDAKEPQNEVWITEFGYDTNNESINRINPFAAFSQQEIQAQWLVRTYLILSSLGVDRAAQFMLRDVEGNGQPRWRDCGLTLSSDEDYAPKVSWYYVFALKTIMEGMYFDKVIQETEGAWVYRFKNEKRDKYIYALWSPSGSGKESEYQLSIPQNATELFQLDLANNSKKGVRTNIDLATGEIAVDISETPVFIVTNFSEPTGFKELNNASDEMNLFPNPSTGKLSFTIPNNCDKETVRGELYNQHGQKIENVDLENTLGETVVLDLTGYVEGMYLLRLSDQQHVFTGKFMKQ